MASASAVTCPVSMLLSLSGHLFVCWLCRRSQIYIRKVLLAIVWGRENAFWSGLFFVLFCFFGGFFWGGGGVGFFGFGFLFYKIPVDSHIPWTNTGFSSVILKQWENG